ncbi:MAG: trypsin-like peptidase domain-containing protein [Phycisphaeraceae bacterium]|nr:trypsin-like peptidase domain-containing protein [Phycisphaeraceae bacterium]
MRRFVSYGPAFVVLITTLMMLLAAPAMVRRVGYATSAHAIVRASQSLADDDILERLNTAVRNVAKKVEPSVVHIQWDNSSRNRRMRGVAQGSGWVYDSKGHIVTNAHVVSGAPGLVVQFYDGRRVPAEVVGVDKTTDVAVIKVNTGEGLFPVERASGTQVSQGDRVFAFGSPFGFKFSMSEGIISGLGRDPATIIGDSGGYTNYIQSDAAVNPGNSGGPLVDIRGRLVGMNVAIATAMNPRDTSGGGQSAGISFAIPLDTIEYVASQLIDSGTVAKGFLGVNLPSPTPAFPDAEEFNRSLLQNTGFPGRGVVLVGVDPSGPAGKAGLQPGDIVVAIAGFPVTSIAALRQTTAIHRPGEAIDVEVLREGERKRLSVVLGNRDQSIEIAIRAEQAVITSLNEFGIIGVLPADEGLQIHSLRNASPAMNSGFSPGLVITSVEGRPIRSGEELVRILVEVGFANGRRLSVTVLDPAEPDKPRTLTMQHIP